MGYSICWLGFKQATKSAVTEILEMNDTGKVSEVDSSEVLCAELPTGWTVVWSNNIVLWNEEQIASFAKGHNLIAVFVEEHANLSLVLNHSDGKLIWSVGHDPGRGGIYNLEAPEGFPSEFDEIASAMKKRQALAGGESALVDYVFDVPVDIAELLTGFRHDRLMFEWGEPQFTALIKQ